MLYNNFTGRQRRSPHDNHHPRAANVIAQLDSVAPRGQPGAPWQASSTLTAGESPVPSSSPSGTLDLVVLPAHDVPRQ